MMRFLQGLIFAAGALLLVITAFAALQVMSESFMGLVWALQIGGLAAIIAVLAVAAVQPDKPIMLKKPSK